MSIEAPLLVAIKAVITVLGGVVTHVAYRAYRRTGSPALKALAAGFAAVTLGGILGGVVHQVAGFDVLTGALVQSALTALGLAVVAYSLYVEERPDHAAVARN